MSSSIKGATFNKAQYDISLKIKGNDYSADVNKIRIISSLNSPYQIVNLELSMDSNDIILAKLFGKDPINLSIRLTKEDVFVSDQLDFELMMIKNNFSVSTKVQFSQNSQIERTPINIIAIPRKPFRTITNHVNDVYLNQTLKQIIQDLCKKSNTTLIYDTDGENTQIIDQVIILPTTLYKTIQYLDDTFGLYSGPSAVFCQHDNKLYIKNLASKVNKNQTFTIYQLASDDKDNTKTINSCNDGKNFYTYAPIKNNYLGNQKFSTIAKTTRFIAKPKDKLYHLLENDLNDVCQKYGIISKNNNIEFDSELSNRISYDIGSTGHDISNTPVIAKIAKKISNLSSITIGIERNLPILNLMNVGESVKLITKIIEHIDLSGKYILKSSDITFQKQGGWQSTCIASLMRTNQSN
jgi:hypothetical protein